MVVDIRPIEDLKLRLSNPGAKPVSFLVGAPLSWADGKGVPAVNEFIAIVRERLSRAGADFEQALTKRLSGADPAKRYQEAMSVVYNVLDADAAAEIVQSAVLKARKATAPEFDFSRKNDGDPNDWHIPRGVTGLARLIKASPDRFPGPIFTTNFDPLIDLALNNLGIRAQPFAIPLDGSIDAVISSNQDQVNVFHIHGYWRDSPTLHMPQQLTLERPQLRTSLETHLNDTNLLVVAYSGWDDVFTTALANCFNNSSFKGLVTWCFYSKIPAELREQNQALLEKFQNGIGQGRISFFCGVDCHSFFDDLVGNFGISAEHLTVADSSPLVGWEQITPNGLNALEPLRGEEAIRYFDGAVPTWRHAISPLIPQLSRVAQLSERISQALHNTSDCGFQLIRAAGGEGKSTMLLQAAAEAAQSGDWNVLYRTSVDTGLNPDVVASLDPQRNWLLVADDAEGLVADLWVCAQRLHQLGRKNVLFLMATRDTDWNFAGGNQKGWATRLLRLDDIVLAGIGKADAGWIIDAWSKLGEQGLRALAESSSRDARIQRLIWAVRSQDDKPGEGSFFGGLLETRFSNAALTDHLVALMAPLRNRDVLGGRGSHYDALIYVAACHSARVPGLDKRVLATLLEVPSQTVSSSVVRALGRELGIAETGRRIFTRHRRVADALIVAAEQSFDTDLCDIWRSLVETTAKIGRSLKVGKTDQLLGTDFHAPIIHAGAKLYKNLPIAIDETRRGKIGIAAAEAACAHQPEWLGVVTDLARAHRFAGYFAEAARVMRSNLRGANNKMDFSFTIRGYFLEWSICEGKIGGRRSALANALLAALSIADALKPEVTLEDAKLTCAGLGVAFGNLQSGAPDCIFAKGRRAVTELGWRTHPDARTSHYFQRHGDELDKLDTSRPGSLDDEIAWLVAATLAAHKELDDRFLLNLYKGLHEGGTLTFGKLRKAVFQH